MPKEKGRSSPRRFVERAIKAYVTLRDEKSRIQKAADEKIANIQTKLSKLEEALRAHMKESGVESVRATSGTAFVTFQEYVNVESWDSLLDWIVENDAYNFLTRSVAKSAVKEYLEESGSLPPGVRYEREKKVQIRRAS